MKQLRRNTIFHRGTNCCSIKQTLKKYVDFLKNRGNFSRTISYKDMETAKLLLLRKAQWKRFPEEMEALAKRKEISNKSSIRTLVPFLDKKGTLRSRGRL